MLTITPGTTRPPGHERDGRPGVRTPLLVSLGVNTLLIVGFFSALRIGYEWHDALRRPSGDVPAERISFLRLPPGQTSQPGRSGGDGQPLSRRNRAATRPTVAAPSAVPAAAEPADAPATGAPEAPAGPGGSGGIVGEGGPTQGIRPTYVDPALWARPGTIVAAPRTAKQRIDSVIADRLTPVRDSIAAAQAFAAGQRKPGDWTMKGPGGTWGMDQQNLHLGKIKVPTALLGLLSSNFQKNLRGNPTEMANERRLAEVRRDLMAHAEREMNEDDFRGAVRAIRARKDRERNARLAERRQAAENAPVAAEAPAAQPR